MIYKMSRKSIKSSPEELISQGWLPFKYTQRRGSNVYEYLVLEKDGKRHYFRWKPEYEKYLNKGPISQPRIPMENQDPPEDEKEKKEAAALATDYRVWWERITQQRPLIEGIVKKVTWLQDAIWDIGFAAFMTLSQFSKVPPNEWFDRLRQYQDKDVFVQDQLRFMAALLQASTKASIVAQLEKEVKALDIECELCIEAYNKLKEKYRNDIEKLLKRMSLMVASMCDQDRERYMQADILIQMGELGIKEEKKEINNEKVIQKL